jgi:AP-3 complex subunit mu
MSTGMTASAATPEQYGQYVYDPTTKVVRWTLGRLAAGDRAAQLTVRWSTSQAPSHSSALSVAWSQTTGISGLRVASVDVTNPATHPYRPFKGVRSVARGRVVWRL